VLLRRCKVRKKVPKAKTLVFNHGRGRQEGKAEESPWRSPNGRKTALQGNPDA